MKRLLSRLPSLAVLDDCITVTTLSCKGSSRGSKTGGPATLALLSLIRLVIFGTSSCFSAPENQASKTSFSRPLLFLPPCCEPVRALASPLHHQREKFEEEKYQKDRQWKGFVQTFD